MDEQAVAGERWLGAGPYRVWKNRMAGPTLGMWKVDYNDTSTGALWVYPEFKGYFGPWRWAILGLSQGGGVGLASAQEDLFLGVLRPREGEKPPASQIVYPAEGGLFVLHAIAPIGTKTQKPEILGPQGQPNRLGEEHRGTVYLRFEFLENDGTTNASMIQAIRGLRNTAILPR